MSKSQASEYMWMTAMKGSTPGRKDLPCTWVAQPTGLDGIETEKKEENAHSEELCSEQCVFCCCHPCILVSGLWFLQPSSAGSHWGHSNKLSGLLPWKVFASSYSAICILLVKQLMMALQCTGSHCELSTCESPGLANKSPTVITCIHTYIYTHIHMCVYIYTYISPPPPVLFL